MKEGWACVRGKSGRVGERGWGQTSLKHIVHMHEINEE